tara:strand:- start:1520 stop:2305 length:786 start_codon:yes stop_codon:yes gene_type:complete
MICTSISYLRFIKALCDNNFALPLSDFIDVATNSEHLFTLMCHYDFWDKAGKQAGFNSLEESITALRDQNLQKELSEVIEILIEQLEVSEFAMPKVDKQMIDSSPIKMHVRHPKEHILVAFGESDFAKKSSSREGVLDIPASNTALLFVTLNKNEKQFSATTMYHDYAMSPTLFHWQTQNNTKPQSKRGIGYIKQKENNKTFILFVREQAEDENGKTIGFVNFGLVDFVKYEGSQPMNITWKLKHPMPAYLWHETAKLAVG